MARLLALDWDRRQARFVVAETRGAQLTIEAAVTLPMPEGVEGASARLQLAAALKEALAAHKVSRAKTLLALERSQVEVVNLTVPPAAETELPELVANQAMRESSAIGEDATIDFVALDSSANEPCRVTAVAISNQRLEQLQAQCTEAGVTPSVIGMRPYAAAAAWLHTQEAKAAPAASLIVSVLEEEVDLAVVQAGKVVFWRTLRQSGASQDPAAAKRLLGEISRTLLVAQGQGGVGAVEVAYLFGADEEHTALVAGWNDVLTLPLSLVNPLRANVTPPSELLEHPGRFAALVGLLAVEAAGGAHALDFLHPKKRPAPPDRRRTYILAGAAGALVLFLGLYSVWSTFAELDARNEELATKLSELESDFKRAGQQQKAIAAVSDWRKDDVNWLDELRDLSLRFPSGRDAVVLRMNLSHGRQAGGNIDMTGVLRDPAIVSRLENNLRDKYHQISSRHVQQRLQDNHYSWQFESSLSVLPRDKKQYLSHLPPEVQAERLAAEAKPAKPAKKPVARPASTR